MGSAQVLLRFLRRSSAFDASHKICLGCAPDPASLCIEPQLQKAVLTRPAATLARVHGPQRCALVLQDLKDSAAETMKVHACLLSPAADIQNHSILQGMPSACLEGCCPAAVEPDTGVHPAFQTFRSFLQGVRDSAQETAEEIRQRGEL